MRSAVSPRWLSIACVSLACAGGLWGLGYLFLGVPGPWFGGAQQVRYGGDKMSVTHGTGHVEGERMVILAPDSSGLGIASLTTPGLNSADYRRVRWTLSGLNPGIELAMLWRSDYAPTRISSVVLQPSPDGAQVEMHPGEGDWIGRINGLALSVSGTLQQPLIIQSVTVDPENLSEVLTDRLRDWFTFRPWTGLSINAAIGGLEDQAVWLPVGVAVIALTAIGLCVGWQRWRRWPAYPTLPLAIGAIAFGAWILLDARWLVDRLLQTKITAAAFAGKSSDEKHLADFDGDLYAFAQQVRAKLPPSPARVYVAADLAFFRGRLAYFLYPNNVYINHGSNAMPPPSALKPGEYVAAYRRRGMQYDAAKQLLRWDDEPPVRAEIVVTGQGSALFKLL